MNNTKRLIKLENDLLNKIVRANKEIVELNMKRLVEYGEVVKVIKITATEIGVNHFKATIEVARFEKENLIITLIERGSIKEFISHCLSVFSKIDKHQ